MKTLLFWLGILVAGVASGQTGPGSLDDYIYTAPPGWTPTRYSDGIVLFAPEGNTNERCNITLWPMRTAGANISADVNAVFAEVFKVYALRDGMTRNSMIRGISPQGWEYFMLKNALQIPNGNYQMMYGFIFVAVLGPRLAIISGISKDPLVSACFGLNLTDVWPHFFYSLQFKNWNSPVSAQKMMNRMAGVWMSVTATAGDRWVMAPNGRYASAAAAQRYAQASTGEVLRITDAYFGNGSYSLQGYAITFTSDQDKDHPEKGWWRQEQESYDRGATWVDKLYVLRVSKIDGKEYEAPYSRAQ
ncbi:MAG TPA: hypothetical protein VHD83_04160 [Puia sp.]|nr:hypothetical protein [Puia sp.]